MQGVWQHLRSRRSTLLLP